MGGGGGILGGGGAVEVLDHRDPDLEDATSPPWLATGPSSVCGTTLEVVSSVSKPAVRNPWFAR